MRAAAFAAQSSLPLPAERPTRPDVAAIDHDRIPRRRPALSLAGAHHPVPSIALPAQPGSGAADYYSEPEPGPDAPACAPASPPPFLAHRDALFTLGLAVPALTAAYLLPHQ